MTVPALLGPIARRALRIDAYQRDPLSLPGRLLRAREIAQLDSEALER